MLSEKVKSPSLLNDKFKLADLPYSELFFYIVHNFPPDIHLFHWRACYDDLSTRFPLKLSDYRKKPMLYQAIFNLTNIRIAGKVYNLIKFPKDTNKHVHHILHKQFCFANQAKKVAQKWHDWGLFDLLDSIPNKAYHSLEEYISHFQALFFPLEPSDANYIEKELRRIQKKLKFLLPKEGALVYDKSSENFMRFRYTFQTISGKSKKATFTGTEVIIYCNQCQTITRHHISFEKLLRIGDSYGHMSIWCRSCSNPFRYFELNYNLTELRYKNSYAPRNESLSENKVPIHYIQHVPGTPVSPKKKKKHRKSSHPNHIKAGKKAPYKKRKIQHNYRKDEVKEAVPSRKPKIESSSAGQQSNYSKTNYFFDAREPRKDIATLKEKVQRYEKKKEWTKCYELSLWLYKKHENHYDVNGALKWLVHALCFYLFDNLEYHDFVAIVDAKKALEKGKIAKSLRHIANVVSMSHSKEKLGKIADLYWLIAEMYLKFDISEKASIIQ